MDWFKKKGKLSAHFYKVNLNIFCGILGQWHCIHGSFLCAGVKRFVYISAADFGVANYLLQGYYEGKVFV